MSEFIVIGQRAEDGIAIDFSKPAVGELVRCKDCRWWEEENHDCIIRDSYGWDYKPTDYCSYGERKDNEHE